MPDRCQVCREGCRPALVSTPSRYGDYGIVVYDTMLCFVMLTMKPKVVVATYFLYCVSVFLLVSLYVLVISVILILH